MTMLNSGYFHRKMMGAKNYFDFWIHWLNWLQFLQDRRSYVLGLMYEAMIRNSPELRVHAIQLWIDTLEM